MEAIPDKFHGGSRTGYVLKADVRELARQARGELLAQGWKEGASGHPGGVVLSKGPIIVSIVPGKPGHGALAPNPNATRFSYHGFWTDKASGCVSIVFDRPSDLMRHKLRGIIDSVSGGRL